MNRKIIKSDYPRIFNAWRGMKERCRSPNHVGAKYYFNKGISVCPEWSSDLLAFFQWSLKNGFEPHLTIDRINSNKGYSPDNCRWVSYLEQGRNLSKNRKIRFRGKTRCLSEWSEITGVSSGLLLARIGRLGWSTELALTTPVGVIPTGPKPKRKSC